MEYYVQYHTNSQCANNVALNHRKSKCWW